MGKCVLRTVNAFDVNSHLPNMHGSISHMVSAQNLCEHRERKREIAWIFDFKGNQLERGREIENPITSPPLPLPLTALRNVQRIGNDSNFRSKCICHRFGMDSVHSSLLHRCQWQVCICSWNLKHTERCRITFFVLSRFVYCSRSFDPFSITARTWLNSNGCIQCQMIRFGCFLTNVNRIQIRCNVNCGEWNKCACIVVLLHRR